METGIEFFYHIPDTTDVSSRAAKVAIELSSVPNRLTQTERSRCDHLDGRPENVSEHENMLAHVAPHLASTLYPDLDIGLVSMYANIHDDLEAYVGDTPTDTYADLDLSAKKQKEEEALRVLLLEFSHIPEYAHLIQSYESADTAEARFVRATDKLMVLLVHFYNDGSILKSRYTATSSIESEEVLLARDRHKYYEFDKIIELRKELAQVLVARYLS